MDYGLIALSAGCGVVVGYALARLDALCSVGIRTYAVSADVDDTRPVRRRTAKISAESDEPAVKISIDDAKFVGEISTAGMAKTEHSAKELGKTMQTNDDIGSSVSKLAQLKGK